MLDWAQTLADWQDPLSLLTLEPFNPALAAHLREKSLQLLPLSPDGLQQLVGAEKNISGTAPRLPLSLQSDTWPTDPASQQRRLKQLHEFMGEDGMLLLSTLALYPQLHLGLAAALDRQLFGDNNVSRRARLFRLLRLPWARHGWLPESLRHQLVDAQTPVSRSRAQECYRNLFTGLTARGELELPFSHADGWSALRLFLGLRGVGEQDVLFLSLVAGPAWLKRLSFHLPGAGRILARIGLHHLLTATAALCLAALPLLLSLIHI